MSYILDALRRADAERRRGQAPALTDVAGLGPLAAPPPRKSPAQRLAPWLALALGTVAAVLLAAWWLRAPGGQAPQVPTPVPAAPVAAAPAPAVTPQVLAPAAPPSPPPPLPPAPVVRPPPAAAAALKPPSTPAPSATAGPAPANPPRVAMAPATPAPASAPPPRPVPASGLPEPQRGAVARLAFGGAVHSADRSQSFVLMGSQLVREGETLAPGIVLDRIAPRSLLLRVDGQLVELPL